MYSLQFNLLSSILIFEFPISLYRSVPQILSGELCFILPNWDTSQLSISCQCWFSHERFLLLTSLQPSALCFKHSSALSIAPRLMDILKIVTHLHYIKITNTFKHKKLCNKNPHRISQILTYLYIILFSFTSKHLHNHLMLSFIWIFMLINIQMKMSMSTCFSITIAGIR